MHVPLSRADVPLWMAPGWQCFQPASLKRAENMANLAPCPGSILTWVHQLRLSRNLLSMEKHYDYEVLMLEAGAEKIGTAHLNTCCETQIFNKTSDSHFQLCKWVPFLGYRLQTREMAAAAFLYFCYEKWWSPKLQGVFSGASQAKKNPGLVWSYRVVLYTLPETNIAHENPHFSW